MAGGFGADVDRFGFAAVLVFAAATRGFDLAGAFAVFRAGFAARGWAILFGVARDLTRFAATDFRLTTEGLRFGAEGLRFGAEGLRFGAEGLRLAADLARVGARLGRGGARRVFFSAMKVPASGGL